MRESQRVASMELAFGKQFGGKPAVWVRAPGRVDLMGSHTDYNEGYVLTLSINLDTWLALRPRGDRVVAVHSLNTATGSVFSLDAIRPDRHVPWTNYVRGVASVLQWAGYTLQGFDGIVHSTVPLSSGLSSSAALEVATAIAFQVLGDFDIDPVTLALLCQRAESEFVGVNCGILDQYTSLLGRTGAALLLDCRHLTSSPVPIAEGIRVVVCDTCAKRELVGTEYAERRAQCEEGTRQLASLYPRVRALRDVTLSQLEACEPTLPPVIARRCRFVVEENERAIVMARALTGGDRMAIAALTAGSYSGARDLYEICSREMEAMMVAMMQAPGVLGARQAGGGFGGCMVAFVDSALAEEFEQHVRVAYERATGIAPRVYRVESAAAAGEFHPGHRC